VAPHDLRTTASTQTTASTRTTACPMRRPVSAVARRRLTASRRTSLTTIGPTDASAVLSWPARLANGCNRQHPGRQPIPLLMTSLEPHRSRSGHGRRKWLITTSKWLVQMHKLVFARPREDECLYHRNMVDTRTRITFSRPLHGTWCYSQQSTT